MVKKDKKLKVISENKHPLSPKNISHNAIKVMEGLNRAGFKSYLVGGSIRDILLGSVPKDFDIATNATPEQVKCTFRNARIIGRRFRIVHVRFGREIIEVTTFRGQANNRTHEKGDVSFRNPADHSQQQVESTTGQLLRDNVYGDMHSDALRRDFTINALYYCLDDHSIYDYTQGIEDIEKRQLRMIGDPYTRYKEDPVRLLRAVRFAAKLGFHLEENTMRPIFGNTNLLTHVSPARLFDEILKLFLNGSATATYSLLQDYQLLDVLFPNTMKVIDKSPYFSGLIDEVISNTDKRIRNNKRVTPAFIYGALLWPAFIYEQHKLVNRGVPVIPAVHQAADTVINQQLARVAIPKRFLIPMRQIWELQWQLPKRTGKQAERTLSHEKFRAGYDFLLMRETAGEQLHGLGHWWTRYQDASESHRQKMIDELQLTQKPLRTPTQ
ncbi:poly(A) polymerase [Candidatus Endobugula sertula]|uniref:Poly(A) polymerase I n=1 Tax=Candidatus Endobugula sertula TaxID=62101 RepID=A0A1D2QTA9_9GAMM|nr:poly(A) polymerase [Candidatus Endobugula sertula]